MSPVEKEVIQLSRELGTAMGLLECILVSNFEKLDDRTVAMSKEFIQKTENRKSYLTDDQQ